MDTLINIVVILSAVYLVYYYTRDTKINKKGC